MRRNLPMAFAAMILSCPAWSQDPAGDPPAAEPQPEAPQEQQSQQGEGDAAKPEAEAGTAEAGTAEDESGIPDVDEKTVLDDQTFEGEDDDFIPTEEIPLSEPIPFPTDI